uniref:Uncharacterized protein n=1 Tax=uncultured prokaryote TaxID=198431 RepID=A0A0H5Q5U3_9ZZZZ|nr:hypothetical protein [uncultured prokaryote]
MAELPHSVEISVRTRRDGCWHARAVGWGLDRGGRYGSLWELRLALPDLPARTPVGDVLRAVGEALVARSDTARESLR